MRISAQFIFLAALVCLRPGHSHAFLYSSDVPQQQQWMMESDLRYLEKVPGTLSSPFLATTLRQRKYGAGHLKAWLGARVKIVTGSQFRLNLKTYDFFDKIEEIQATNVEIFDEDRAEILMTNFGGPIYAAGKRRSIFYVVEVPGVGEVLVDSPRRGLVRVGDALFSPLVRNSVRIDNSLHAIYRLHNYFHEARHSDGNGESLTMPHVACPEGHAYAGRFACDSVVNAAYRVGAEVLRDLTGKCSDCSRKDKELLAVLRMDEQSRILGLASGAKTESEICSMVRAWGKIASFCDRDTANELPLWDDRGEIAR